MTERVTVDAIDQAGVVAGQFLDGTVELAFVYVIVELDKAYQPQYDHTKAHEYVSFQAEDFLHALARYGGGKEPEEFYVIQAKRTHELRLDEVNLLRKIREAVVLTEETILQKVIAPGRVESYLRPDGWRDVGGFVSRWQDVTSLKSSDEIVDHLGLKYYPGEFWKGEGRSEIVDHVFALRFSAGRLTVGNCKDDEVFLIPYGGNNLAGMMNMGGNQELREPFMGNGFTCSRTHLIPEFVISEAAGQRGIPLPNRSELYKIDREGQESLVAVYDQKNDRFYVIERLNRAGGKEDEEKQCVSFGDHKLRKI